MRLYDRVISSMCYFGEADIDFMTEMSKRLFLRA